METLEREAEAHDRTVAAVRAVIADNVAKAAAERLARASELNARLPDGPPSHPSEDDALSRQVEAALTRWRERPQPREPIGATIPELEQRLAELDLGLAVLADADAARAEEHLERVRILAAKFPDGGPRLPSEDEALALQVEAALTEWNTRPQAVDLMGEPACALAEQIREIDRQLAEFDEAHRARASSGGLGGLLRAIVDALARLWRALTGSGDPPTEATVDAEETLTQRRAALQQQHGERAREEKRAHDIQKQRSRAEDAVQRAATAVGANVSTPDADARALLDWRALRDEELKDADRLRDDWDALQRLLGQHTLAEVDDEARQKRVLADERARTLEPSRAIAGTTGSICSGSRQARRSASKWSTVSRPAARLRKTTVTNRNVSRPLRPRSVKRRWRWARRPPNPAHRRRR